MMPVASGHSHSGRRVHFEDEHQLTPPHHHHEDTYVGNNTGKTAEVAQLHTTLRIAMEQKLLWEVLDEARRVPHALARKNMFLHGLATNGVCQTQFMKYLANLLPIHTALEEAQQSFQQEYLKVFVHPELFRSAAIKKDLEIWEFVADKKFVPWQPGEKTLLLAQHIHDTAKSDPEKTIGIMYALYGTVMSGGQTNKRVVEKSLEGLRAGYDEFPEGSGVSLYEVYSDGAKLDDEGIARLKKGWHESLCKVETLMSEGQDTELFHGKLSHEVAHTLSMIIKIIEENVQESHC